MEGKETRNSNKSQKQNTKNTSKRGQVREEEKKRKPKD